MTMLSDADDVIHCCSARLMVDLILSFPDGG